MNRRDFLSGAASLVASLVLPRAKEQEQTFEVGDKLLSAEDAIAYYNSQWRMWSEYADFLYDEMWKGIYEKEALRKENAHLKQELLRVKKKCNDIVAQYSNGGAPLYIIVEDEFVKGVGWCPTYDVADYEDIGEGSV